MGTMFNSKARRQERQEEAKARAAAHNALTVGEKYLKCEERGGSAKEKARLERELENIVAEESRKMNAELAKEIDKKVKPRGTKTKPRAKS